MLGYMTAKEAKKNGFTHHGSYFGIHVWIGDPEREFMVAAKWAPLELAMSAAHFIEGFLQSMFFPEREPGFQFFVGSPIR